MLILHIKELAMRTNIVIDDKLMLDALQCSGLLTKKATVETALKLLIKMKQQENIKNFRGKLQWTGDLNAMRTDS